MSAILLLGFLSGIPAPTPPAYGVPGWRTLKSVDGVTVFPAGPALARAPLGNGGGRDPRADRPRDRTPVGLCLDVTQDPQARDLAGPRDGPGRGPRLLSVRLALAGERSRLDRSLPLRARSRRRVPHDLGRRE